MRKFIYTICTIVLLTSCSKEKLVHFVVTPHSIDSIPTLKILMEFDAEKNGETTLLFRNRAWGEDNLHDVLRNVKPLNERTKVLMHKDSGWIVLKHPKDLKKVRLQYEIIQDTELPLTTQKTYRPIVQKDYFHIFSHNLFMLPRDLVPNSDALFNIQIDWKGFDDHFNLINTLDSNGKVQKIANTSKRLFHSGLFIGGDFRKYPIEIQGNKVVYAIRGEWKILKDSVMVTILKKTITAQRNFWKDHSQKHFTVSTIPTYLERGTSFQGSGLTNAFATSVSDNDYFEVDRLVYLFNHELQHNWIGHTILNANEEEQYWFSEGFTDYYTIKNIAKHHINNLDEHYFIKKFNETIKNLYASPVKEAPNTEINYDNFWASRDYEKLPYRRGAIFAFYLDNKIRQDSKEEKSLDDLMLAIRDDAVNKNQRIDHEYFIKKVNTFINSDIKPFFTMHIENGTWYDLEAIFDEFGYEYHTETTIFDIGFTFSKDKNNIADIDSSSNAYKAGLRKGDRITRRSYYYGQPQQKAEFKVRRGKEEISYKYLPAKQAKIPTLKDNSVNKKTLYFNP